MLPVINLGPLALPTRGLLLLLSFWLATDVAARRAHRLGLNGDHIYTLTLLGGLAGVLGARLGYVLEHFSVYLVYPAQIIALELNSLSPGWGIVAGVLAGYGYARRKGLASRVLLDALTPGLLVMAGGWALANLAGGDAYGSPSSLPWSIELWGETRHPVQIYEFIAVVVISISVAKSPRAFDGWHFGLSVGLYAAARVLIDGWRGDVQVIDGVRLTQVWSLGVVLAALWWLRRQALAATSSSGVTGSDAGESAGLS